MPFPESHLESAIIELFQQQGYDYVHGDNVVRNYTRRDAVPSDNRRDAKF